MGCACFVELLSFLKGCVECLLKKVYKLLYEKVSGVFCDFLLGFFVEGYRYIKIRVRSETPEKRQQ